MHCLAASLGLLAFPFISAAQGSSLNDQPNDQLDALWQSVPLLPVKKGAVESRRDLYALRRALYEKASSAADSKTLKAWALAEDWYGSAASPVYLRLLNSLVRESAPKEEIAQLCNRGLQVSLREEQFDSARQFAERLAQLGDSSALALISSHSSRPETLIEIPGGLDAFHLVAMGRSKLNRDRFFLDYSRMLSSLSIDGSPLELEQLARDIHRHFQQVAQLAAMGVRKNGHIQVLLTLKDPAGEQRTQKVLAALGLRLARNKTGIVLEPGAKSKVEKQQALAAFNIDDEAIQQALAAGQPYILDIPFDSVSVFPAEPLWRAAFPESQAYAGALAELFANDPRRPQLYVALNSMDRAAAGVLLKAVPLRTLADKYSRELCLFSSALAVTGNRADVPGGSAADAAWQQLTGQAPSDPAAFFKALLNADGGSLIAFFHTLSELDVAHQRFFTRSPVRAKRFYDLFRTSAEMRRGREHRLLSSSFFEFLREVPLTDSGSVDFPGSPEVWMVARGHSESATSVAKITRKLKQAAAPDDEDAILIRLATTAYKADVIQASELANFIAVARMDRLRGERLSPEAALLLAQSYTTFGSLYPYFPCLGDLEAVDFQHVFDLVSRLYKLDFVTANTRLGQLHSFLEIICLLEQSGRQSRDRITELYRKGIDRYSNAQTAAAWTTASLAAIDEVARLAPQRDPMGRDAAIRTLLVGAPVTSQVLAESDPENRAEEEYDRVLALQRVPSFDALFSIRDGLKQVPKNPAALENIEKQISSFVTIVRRSAGTISLQMQHFFERNQTADLEKIVSGLSNRIATGQRERAEVDRLSEKLLAGLQPWVQLAMSGQIYARYLDPSDLIVSEDPTLLRKHIFTNEYGGAFWRGPCPPSDFVVSSSGAGSRFAGGFAQFSLAAGRARAEGNHLGGRAGQAVAGAVFASVRGTDWRPLTESTLQTFAANVRIAREWIVASATSDTMRRQLERESIGLLSLSRRKVLMTSIDLRDWSTVWESVSISDLFFLGKALAEQAPAPLWTTPALLAMRQVAAQPQMLNVLGQVAPDLSGSAEPRLLRYQPYEEYERYYMPLMVAQRVAELKLYLAWLADSSGWQPAALASAAYRAADAVLKKLEMRDIWDWSAALDAYRRLQPETLDSLLNRQ